ncbi:MAG TPA: DUF4350 domain-containing protein [Polyangia bacterium]|nr:DUF4350 domain-containing protein [Polyangia bacterium]
MLAPLILGLSAALAADYRVESSAWNGLGTLARLGQELGCPVTATETLDWGALSSRDVLFLVYPTSPVAADDVAGFLRAGGRLVVADDFGAAGPALARLGIHRTELQDQEPIPGAAIYRGRPQLVVASARGDSPLGRATNLIVTNHPAVFTSRRLEPAFEFAPGRAAVYEGRLGRGRFVALSDPSVLINNMLALPENRLFAAALIAQMCRPQPAAKADRIVLYTGAFAVRGHPPRRLSGMPEEPQEPWSERVSELGDALNQEAGQRGSRVALGLGLVALVLLMVARVVPRRLLPHATDWARVPLPARTGFEAMVRRYATGELPWGDQLLGAVLREEVVARLGLALGEALSLEADRPAEIGRRVGAKYGSGVGRRAETLWREVGRLPSPARMGTRISRRRLVRLHRLTAELLARLPGEEPGARPGTRDATT